MKIISINSLALIVFLLSVLSIKASQPTQTPLLGQPINGETSQRQACGCKEWATHVWQTHKGKIILCGVLVVCSAALIASDVISKGSGSSYTNSTMPAVTPHAHKPTPLSLPAANQIRQQQKAKPPFKQKDTVRFKRRYR